MKRELICISCPIGCHIAAELLADGGVEVSGNRCPRGKAYAQNELTDPKRMVTSVVACRSSELPFIPVRSSSPVSMALIDELLDTLRGMEVEPPLNTGSVILKDFRNSGVDIIVTRSVKE